MEPTLRTNQYLLVDKVSYMVGEPKRGDVVVLRFPQDPRRDFIKRVIALPGEEVEVRQGIVYINGQALDEPYILSRPAYPYAKRIVPPGSYFVLGDNRNNSHDSHVWDWLPKEYIIGKAWVSYWPVDTWGTVRHNAVSFADAMAPGNLEPARPPPHTTAGGVSPVELLPHASASTTVVAADARAG